MGEGEAVVRQGAYLYHGTVLCEIQVVRAPARADAGDAGGPPTAAADGHGAVFYVQYSATTARGRFHTRGERVASLAEAVRIAEEAPAIGLTVRWFDR
jgi:hypothetical protein